ncbi:MAG: PP2C family protein-serine/threonine phosphatase [Candidatus Xenobium sp.]|nr:SpoIIE family protein phosphatase [Burkholderiales bacterium]
MTWTWKLFHELDRWLEAAVLRKLPPAQHRVVNWLVLIATALGLGLAWATPRSASLTLMMPIVAGCFLRGTRRVWLLPPLTAYHYWLVRSLPDTLLFLAGASATLFFILVTAEKFRTVRRQGSELRRSLEVARHVQRALEPPSRTEWGLLEMATSIRCSEALGGDFICLRPVGPDRFGILLGDVMGQGVRAALAAAVVTGLYGELAREGFSPSAILEITNRRLNEFFGSFELFATMAALEYDSKHNQWRASVAGHDAPLLLRADGSVEELLERGMAAGIEPDEQYQDMRRPALPGDQIFLASDGLIPYGMPESDVCRMLLGSAQDPADQALQKVVTDLQRRLPPGYRDDMTGLLLRLTE